MNQKIMLCVACALAASGCVKDSAQSLLVTDVVVVQAPQCVADPQATSVKTDGIRDIAISPLTSFGYFLTPRMANLMEDVTQEAIRFNGRGNVRVEVNNLTLQGFDVCYEFPSPTANVPDPVPTCDDLGGKQFIQFAGGEVAVNSKAVALLDVFPPAITAQNTQFSDTVKASGASKTVNVHLQAIARTQDGRQIKSNDFIFPITLCAGCLAPSNAVVSNGFLTCPAGQVPDATTICFSAQDVQLKCVMGTGTSGASGPT